MAHKKRKIKHILYKKAKGGYQAEVHYHPPVARGKEPQPYNPSDFEPEPHVLSDMDAVHDHMDDHAPMMTTRPDEEPESPKKGKSRYRRMAADFEE